MLLETRQSVQRKEGGGIKLGTKATEVAVVQGNVFDANFASSNGGGLEVSGPALIRGNVFSNNVTGEGDGGAIYRLVGSGPIIVENNLITSNMAGDHGGGIYVFNNDLPVSSIQIVQNVIVGNTSSTTRTTDCSGGGLWIQGSATILDNTITFNSATANVYPAGGGICIQASAPPSTISRNIVYGNAGGGIVVFPDLLQPGPWQVNLVDNLLFGNEDIDVFVESGADTVWSGNLFVNPLLCVDDSSSLGDLCSDSPALIGWSNPIGAVAEPGCVACSAVVSSRARLDVRGTDEK